MSIEVEVLKLSFAFSRVKAKDCLHFISPTNVLQRRGVRNGRGKSIEIQKECKKIDTKEKAGEALSLKMTMKIKMHHEKCHCISCLGHQSVLETVSPWHGPMFQQR